MHQPPKRAAESVDKCRRILVLGATGAALAPIAGCGGGASSMNGLSTTRQLTDAIVPAGTERSLPIVPLDPGTLDVAGVRQFALVAQSGTSQFSAGVTTNTLGYNGALLGPALKLRTGERTQIRVHNGLTEETTVHWHGLLVAADIDGGPHQTIAPGAQWQASFVVANPAATCWFHPHTHGATGRQVVQGLAGLLIVDDSALNPSTLPSTWGVDDVALVLQDKRFDAQGQIDYVLSTNDRQMGYMGDVLLVNGTAGAVWRAPQQWVRMRMLNGCNARTLTLRLGSGAPMLQIANEAGLLTGPVSRASITLAPGERAEVLVDFSAAVATQSIPLYAGTASDGMGMGASTSREVTALRIVASVPRQPNAMAQPPASLIAAAPVVAQVGATVRTFRLDGGMMGSPFTINGRGFDINRIDLSVPADTVEIWTFTNATDMAHPMHVHGVKMTMLTRGGVAPPVYEQGLRDTFVIEAMQTVQVAVQTAAVASSSPLMYHCHILEHEDAGMMGQFITV